MKFTETMFAPSGYALDGLLALMLLPHMHVSIPSWPDEPRLSTIALIPRIFY